MRPLSTLIRQPSPSAGRLSMVSAATLAMEGSASPRKPRVAIDSRSSPTSLDVRSEEHTSELQSLMRISYAVFCLKKKKNNHSKNEIQLLHQTDNNPLLTIHTHEDI